MIMPTWRRFWLGQLTGSWFGSNMTKWLSSLLRCVWEQLKPRPSCVALHARICNTQPIRRWRNKAKLWRHLFSATICMRSPSGERSMRVSMLSKIGTVPMSLFSMGMVANCQATGLKIRKYRFSHCIFCSCVWSMSILLIVYLYGLLLSDYFDNIS